MLPLLKVKEGPWMASHLLLEKDNFGVLTIRLLCMECGNTWWVSESEKDRICTCPCCHHRSNVQQDRRRALR